MRSQQASTNWWGSEDEAYGAYSTALADATGGEYSEATFREGRLGVDAT